MGSKGSLGYIFLPFLLLQIGLTTPTSAFPLYRSLERYTQAFTEGPGKRPPREGHSPLGPVWRASTAILSIRGYFFTRIWLSGQI
jgi:hypothetical protein